MIRVVISFLLLFSGSLIGGEMLYVAPDGKPGAAGTKEEPLATVNEALTRVAGGGVIRLREGTYHESVRVQGRGTEPLLIEAEPGEEVWFNGGRKLINAEPWPEKEGLFVVPISEPEVQAVWDPALRVRFLHQLDIAGVAAWQGSFMVMEDGRLLVHPAEGGTMEGVMGDLHATGMEINRSHTTVRNLRFTNYLGVPGAAGIRIGTATGVTVEGCLLENMVRGIVMERGARDARVVQCVVRDVATGVQVGGVGIEVEESVFLAAAGAYAIRGEAEYDWSNGIRFYHPAEKGTIRHCVTAGFWAGMYHKTTAGPDGAKPFLCEGNLFLDTIKIGTAPQKGSIYRGNLIFGGKTTLRRLELTGAEVSGNYFFAATTHRKSESDANGNHWGADPFRDRVMGDLQLATPEVLPEGLTVSMEKTIPAHLSWPAELVTLYRKEAVGELEVAKPVVAASEHGTVVTLRLTAPASGELRYRPVGAKGDWTKVHATSAGFSSAETLTAFEWPDDAADDDRSVVARLVFALQAPAIKAKTEYEAEVKVTGSERQPEAFRFTTTGAIRTHSLTAGESLQEVLDRALPGDTVKLSAGVFTEPAILLHGGSEKLPIVIEGAGSGQTILDGGKRHASFLELRNAPHVTLRGIEVRHFDRAGIVIQDSPYAVVEHSFFRNKRQGRSMVQGSGILIKSSPHSRVEGNTFTRLLYGMQAIDSPSLTLEHNTAFNNIFSAAQLKNSARGSRVRYNSFTFTGNISLYILEEDARAFQSLVCDYNNYGTSIRKIGDIASRAYAQAGVTPGEPEPSFPIPERYGRLSGSKRIIDYVPGGGGRDTRERFFNMKAWQTFSGKDAHSIYADPGYADPLRGDFRLLPDSPNQMADGTVIGSSSPLPSSPQHSSLP